MKINIYPLTKLLFVFASIILSIIMPWQFSYLIILPLCIIISYFSKKFKTYIKKIFVILILFLLFIFLFKILLDKTNSYVIISILGKNITTGAVLETLIQTKILISIVATFVLFFEITELEDMMIAMQQANIPSIVGYVFLSSIQMISEMNKKSAIIINSQKARGIEVDGNIFKRIAAFFPSIGPLIISSITDIEEKAITLEIRGFTCTNNKTSLKIVSFKKIDKILIALILITTSILITARVILWLL